MVKDGIPFVLVPLAIALAFLFFHIWAGLLVFGLIAAFMAFFFRDPDRKTPTGNNIIVSAADGRVTRIDHLETGKVVSVFLSPLDVHINRAPIAGRIESVSYVKGRKSPATSDNASIVNERNSLTIVGERMTVVCTQIAGIMARRIVCWNKAGDDLDLGQRFGMIKFGSRTDLLMPANSVIEVGIGQRVVGGETIIARLQETNGN